ncbi:MULTISPECIES: hypothetical protein [unclassified Sinorhizobium]|uniref:hypothetical protein n=1 Tax=unclassified Sinorhizobium TaxID=2613772 RepID=UPI0035252C3D
MKIVEKDGFNRIVEVYALYWVDGIRHHLVIPYEGYDGFIVVNEDQCDVVDSSINGFILKKDDYGGDMLIHWAAEKGGLIYKLTDPPDADAVAELKRRLAEEKPPF